MSADEKIYVDATQPATLNDGAGILTDCPTLQEAVMAWHRCARAEEKSDRQGAVYNAAQIERLHYEPRPAALGSRPLPAHCSPGNGRKPISAQQIWAAMRRSSITIQMVGGSR